jgi:ribose-phosphate pyrophosphokinase
VEQLLNAVGWSQVAFISKRRNSGTETQITNINANVDGKHVVIYDDMTRSGSSLVQAAEAYKRHGAASVSAILTHGVFTKDAEATYAMCKGKLDYLYATDSHPNAVKMAKELSDQGIDFVRIKTCAGVLNDAVIHHLPRGWGHGCDD